MALQVHPRGLYTNGQHKTVTELDRTPETVGWALDYIAEHQGQQLIIELVLDENGDPIPAGAADANGQAINDDMILAALHTEKHGPHKNETSYFKIAGSQFSGCVILGAVSADIHGKVFLNRSTDTPTGLHKICEPDRYKAMIDFNPGREDSIQVKDQRYDLGEFEATLQKLCGLAKSQKVEGTLPSIAKDRYGNIVGRKNFRHWNYREMRQWCLSNFDLYRTTYFTWLLHLPSSIGDDSETAPIKFLASPPSGKKDADLIIHSPDGDISLVFSKNKSCPKNHKPDWLPLAGLPIFSEDGETLVTYEAIKEK